MGKINYSLGWGVPFPTLKGVPFSSGWVGQRKFSQKPKIVVFEPPQKLEILTKQINSSRLISVLPNTSTSTQPGCPKTDLEDGGGGGGGGGDMVLPEAQISKVPTP